MTRAHGPKYYIARLVSFGAGEEDVITAPLRPAVSGDVPAHSGVSAPCGVGYANMCIRNLLDEPSELVSIVVESRKQPEGPLSRLVRLRPISLLIIPV